MADDANPRLVQRMPLNRGQLGAVEGNWPRSGDDDVMTQQGKSVSFDRAAGFYDATRRFSPEVLATQTAQLREALRDVSGPTLEIGVGTGRVALPLAAAGQRLVGVDISAAMLAALHAKSPGAFPLVQADATRLPFRDGSFGGAVVAHVLHLVSDWRAVVGELQRVVRPGGVLLVTRGAQRSGSGPGAEITRRARAAAGWTMPPGRLDDLAELDEHVRDAGGQATSLPAIPTDDPRTADEALRAIETNLMSWTWDFTDEARAAAAAEVREWVTQTYGDPASVVIASAPVQWRRYRLPEA
jgi:ubiquinone/menaquinone biosynthesis C-methylase UbiE